MLISSQLVFSGITGAFLGIPELSPPYFWFEAILVLSSIILLAHEQDLEKITLSSSIKKHQPLLRLTQDAVRNQTVERELNHLIKELSKENLEAGLGSPGHIDETDIYYLRGRRGGRLYYHKIGEHNYEIVAKSAKGRNQNQVINKLKEIYQH